MHTHTHTGTHTHMYIYPHTTMEAKICNWQNEDPGELIVQF